MISNTSITSNAAASKWQRAFAKIESQPASNLIRFDRWLQSIDKTAATGWRWRQRGWIVTVNISGRVYVSRREIKRFEERAASGEFSKRHVTPARKDRNQCGGTA
jgi:Tfp pilus assembly protein FimT